MYKPYQKLHHIVLAAIFILGVTLILKSQDPQSNPPQNPNLTAEQKSQLTRLNQLEEQLQKSREELHVAISQYGWESDQAETAREKLLADRNEYRKLRRSLRASGVTVPPPAGYGAGGADSEGRGYYGRHHGRHHCGCECGW